MTILYTHNSSPKKKPSKKLLELRAKRTALFESIQKTRPKATRVILAPEPIQSRVTVPLSNAVGSGFKKSVDDYKWKKDREETSATIKEIERKKTMVAPLYSKGAVQFITPGSDTKTLGRKV